LLYNKEEERGGISYAQGDIDRDRKKSKGFVDLKSI
jgi:hypothetical protein